MAIDNGLWRDNKRLQATDQTAWGAVVEDTTAATRLLHLMRMHHLKELAATALVFCLLILARSRVSTGRLIVEPIEKTLGQRLSRSSLLSRLLIQGRSLLLSATIVND